MTTEWLQTICSVIVIVGGVYTWGERKNDARITNVEENLAESRQETKEVSREILDSIDEVKTKQATIETKIAVTNTKVEHIQKSVERIEKNGNGL